MVKKSEGVVLGWVANALCQTVKPSEAVVATQLPTRHRTASVSILTRRCAQETGVAGVVGETTDRRGFGEMAISKPYRSLIPMQRTLVRTSDLVSVRWDTVGVLNKVT